MKPLPVYDSLLFDMDGTLWDAVDSYCTVWDDAYRRLGVDYSLTRPQLLACMGLPLAEIHRRVGSPKVDFATFSPELKRSEERLMPKLGGKLYPGVRQTLTELRHRGYKLFMVSNCGSLGIRNFLAFTELAPLFTDTLSFGDTGFDKDRNILLLVERYSLKAPAYVGDIEADSISAHAAGIHMVWARYGFGTCSDAEMSIGSFGELLSLFPTLNPQP